MARWFIQEPNTAPIAPQSWSVGSCGKGLPTAVDHFVLVVLDDVEPIGGGKVGVEQIALGVLAALDDVLEAVGIDVEHDVGIHLDETAIAVIGEALVARRLGERQHRFVVEAEVEDGVHHARHRGAGARTHRNQQRIGGVAEHMAGRLADRRQRLVDLAGEFGRIGAPVGVKVGADFGGDGEAGGDRQAERSHLGEIAALAAQQIAHVPRTLGAAGAEGVNPLRHEQLPKCRPLSRPALFSRPEPHTKGDPPGAMEQKINPQQGSQHVERTQRPVHDNDQTEQ